MRTLKVVLAAVAVVALLAGVGVLLLSRYVQSAGFRRAVLAAAHDTLGADVTIGDLRVSLLRGATLERVTVLNPPGFAGDLLSTDALVMRYRLLPLLRRRLVMEQVSLERPVLRLARDDRGQWNYEKLGVRPGPPAARPSPRPPAPSEAPLVAGGGAIRDLVLSKLAVSGGEIVLLRQSSAVAARIQQLTLTTSVAWDGHTLSGAGGAGIGTLSLANAVFVRQLVTPLAFSGGEIRLAPLAGKLAGGDVSGTLALRLPAGSRYAARVQVRNADVAGLLQEAGATRRVLRGNLQAQLALEGTGGLSTIAGRGHVEITSGVLVDAPILTTLALLLNLPVLRDLAFEECRIEFALAENVLETPVIRLIARDLQLTGRGSVALSSLSFDHQLTLALGKAAFDRAPRALRATLTERADGLRAMDFRVWGPYDALRIDLGDRAVRGIAGELLGQGLRKLFR